MWRVPLFYGITRDKELILLCYETDRAGLLPAPQGVRSLQGEALLKEYHVINDPPPPDTHTPLPSHYVILNIRLELTVKIFWVKNPSLIPSLPLGLSPLASH